MTTTSTVLYRSSADIQMLDECRRVAEAGGTFSIEHVYSSNWFVKYTINWPKPKEQT